MLHVFRPLEYTSRDIWWMEHDKTWSVVATGRVKRFGAEVNRVKYELGMALLWCLCSTSRSMRQRSSFWEGRSSTPRSSITSGATKPSGVQGCPGVREGESTMTMPCESYWKDTVNQQRRKACSGSCLNMANHFLQSQLDAHFVPWRVRMGSCQHQRNLDPQPGDPDLGASSHSNSDW